MKLAVLIIIWLFVVSVSTATDPDPKKTILVIGFSHSYFTSNSVETVAAGNQTDADSIFKFVNNKLLATFTEQLNPKFHYLSVADVSDIASDAHTSFYYALPGKEGGITSVRINEMGIRSLCEFYGADMIMFINSYELNWEDHPYLVYMHTFDSEVFTRSGEKILAERASFMVDDARLKEKYSGKLSRQLSRILKKVEKVDIGNDGIIANH